MSKSIYLKMIDVINERGLGRCQTVNKTHGCVCLLGARAIARGHTVDEIIAKIELAYTQDFDDVPELLELIQEEHDLDKTNPNLLYDNASKITIYNDSIIQGHASKAIDMLKRAEKQRRKNKF